MYTGQGLEAHFIAKNGKLQLFQRRRGHFAAWRAISTRHQHADDRLNVIHVARRPLQRLGWSTWRAHDQPGERQRFDQRVNPPTPHTPCCETDGGNTHAG